MFAQIPETITVRDCTAKVSVGPPVIFVNMRIYRQAERAPENGLSNEAGRSTTLNEITSTKNPEKGVLLETVYIDIGSASVALGPDGKGVAIVVHREPG